MSDKELVEALLSHNEAAFELLVKQYQQVVVRTAFAYLKDKDEAEDLAQEVFISVFENISKFRGDANLKTWICRICINKSINELRKQKWKNTFQRIENAFGRNNLEIEDSTTPFTSIEKQQQEEAIDKAMSKLPDNQRTAFILHKYDEMSQQEIADVMNISVSAVESLVHRAKQRLQQQLLNIFKK